MAARMGGFHPAACAGDSREAACGRLLDPIRRFRTTTCQRLPDLALEPPDGHPGGHIHPARLVLRSCDPQEQQHLAAGEPPRLEGGMDRRQGPEAPLHLQQRMHPPDRKTQALGHVVGRAGEPEIEVAGQILHPSQQARDAQFERVAHAGEAPQVPVEEKGAEVAHEEPAIAR